jgi:hypothetical protein
MSLQQEGHILAAFLWLVILLGPPLALALLTPMFYVDGATSSPHSQPVKVDNRATLLLLLITFCAWVLLLKFLYLPAIGFDTDFLTVNTFAHYDYTDLGTLKTLGDMTLNWIGRDSVAAIGMLAFVPLLGMGILFMARTQGRAAATPPTPQTRWR